MTTYNSYQSFKASAIKDEPIRKTVSLQEIVFVTSGFVEINGVPLTLSDKALEDICLIIGLSKRINFKMEHCLGEQAALKVLNLLKNAISSRKDMRVTISVNRSRRILRVYENATGLLTYENFFHLTETVIDKNNLSPKSFSINQDGELVINTEGNNNQFDVKGFSDEVFNTGLSFINDHQGMHVDPYIMRLVCTNGMVTRLFKESVKLSSLSYKQMESFYFNLERLEKQKFRPSKFTEKLKEAYATPASLSEIQRGIDIITSQSNISKEEVEKYIPHYQTYSDYKRMGISVKDLSAVKRRNAKSSITVWNLINGITDFASHDYGYAVKPEAAARMQIAAGDLLCKQFDIANLMDVSPY